MQAKNFTEIRSYAKKLGIHIKYIKDKKSQYKTKKDLINEIELKVHDAGNLLYRDWMTRLDTGRTVWKILFDTLKKYTLSQLQTIAGKVGIPTSGKTVKELSALLRAKTNHDAIDEKQEKEEKDEKVPIAYEQYQPHYGFSQIFQKNMISLNNVPFEADIITELINHDWKTPEPVEGNSLAITITVMANISSFIIGTKQPVDNRQCNLWPLRSKTVNGKITLQEVEEWMKINDEHFQNIVSKSEYADIENIYEVDISCKSIPNAGRGFVSLINPENFPNIFNPECEFDCFLLCLYDAKIKFKSGITLHQIKQNEIIGGFVSKEKIAKILEYLITPRRIVLHNLKNGVFPTIHRECTYIPHKTP